MKIIIEEMINKKKYGLGLNNYKNTVYTGNAPQFTSKITMFKTTYHVLGEDVEVEGIKDFEMVICLSTLNVLGKPFYDELKKNLVTFPKEIEEFLKVSFRDQLLNDILN